MLYLLNEEARVQVDTPVGLTDEFIVKEVVRQGTVFGPTFCCASTAAVNVIGEEVVEQIGEVSIGMPIFMDDVNTATRDIQNIEKAIRNCRRMEKEKKYTFGLKKTNYMIIDEQKGRTSHPKGTLEQGEITRVTQYKYGGIHVNEKGNLDLHIELLKEKSQGVYREIMAMGSPREVGEKF